MLISVLSTPQASVTDVVNEAIRACRIIRRDSEYMDRIEAIFHAQELLENEFGDVFVSAVVSDDLSSSVQIRTWPSSRHNLSLVIDTESDAEELIKSWEE